VRLFKVLWQNQFTNYFLYKVSEKTILGLGMMEKDLKSKRFLHSLEVKRLKMYSGKGLSETACEPKLFKA